MNLRIKIFLLPLILFASEVFAGGASGGGGVQGKPLLSNRPGNLYLDVMDSALIRENLSQGIATGDGEEVKATVGGRVIGRLGKSTYLSVTRESFELLKESMNNDDPVADRLTNKEYVFSEASETAISLESLSDDQNVIILPSHPVDPAN